MKYVLFIIALLNVVPLALWLFVFKGMGRYVIGSAIVLLLFFSETALNFFSHSWYRGTSRGMEISLIYLMCLSLLLSRFLANGWRSLLPETGSRLYALYTVLCLPSLLTAASGLMVWCELWKMLMMQIVFLGLYYYLCDTDDWACIVWTLAGLVVVNFLWVIREHLVGTAQVRGFFPHQNSLSIFMEFLGTMFLAYYLNQRAGMRSWFALILFLMASVCVFRTYSRGAIVMYPIGCAVTTLATFWRGRSAMRFMRIYVIGICGLLGMLIFVGKVVSRFENAGIGSRETRVRLANAAVEMIKAEPLVGVGLNNWGIKINLPYEYDKTKIGLTGAHAETEDALVETVYLMVAAECGLPCFAVMLAWMGYYWMTSLRLTKLLAHTELVFWPIGSLGALTAAYLHSTLEWVLKQQINLIQMIMFFAVISYLNSQRHRLLEKCASQQLPEAKEEP